MAGNASVAELAVNKAKLAMVQMGQTLPTIAGMVLFGHQLPQRYNNSWGITALRNPRAELRSQPCGGSS